MMTVTICFVIPLIEMEMKLIQLFVLCYIIYTTATITNLRLPIRSRDVVRLRGLIKFIYCIKCYLAIKSANELFLN